MRACSTRCAPESVSEKFQDEHLDLAKKTGVPQTKYDARNMEMNDRADAIEQRKSTLSSVPRHIPAFIGNPTSFPARTAAHMPPAPSLKRARTETAAAEEADSRRAKQASLVVAAEIDDDTMEEEYRRTC